ncbi:MAG TPA: Mov34/MPN/PAD-1 family protein [Armatimonadota bacterium]|jgi:proteasome lid subunit RPN8/RPN11
MNEPEELDISLGGTRTGAAEPGPRSPSIKGGVYAAASGKPKRLTRRAYFSEEAIRSILVHAASSPHAEIGGILLGSVVHRRRFIQIKVEGVLPARTAGERRAELTFTHETWMQLDEERARVCPELQIIGWYHTHPGLGVFMSDRDVYIHNNFFAHDGFLALVVDPLSGARGLFHWVEYVVRPMPGYYVYGPKSRKKILKELAAPAEPPPLKPLPKRRLLPSPVWLAILALALTLVVQGVLATRGEADRYAEFGETFQYIGDQQAAFKLYRRARLLDPGDLDRYASEINALQRKTRFEDMAAQEEYKQEASSLLGDAVRQAGNQSNLALAVRDALVTSAFGAPKPFQADLKTKLTALVPDPVISRSKGKGAAQLGGGKAAPKADTKGTASSTDAKRKK